MDRQVWNDRHRLRGYDADRSRSLPRRGHDEAPGDPQIPIKPRGENRATVYLDGYLQQSLSPHRSTSLELQSRAIGMGRDHHDATINRGSRSDPRRYNGTGGFDVYRVSRLNRPVTTKGQTTESVLLKAPGDFNGGMKAGR
jgi:hypothetical protein